MVSAANTPVICQRNTTTNKTDRPMVTMVCDMVKTTVATGLRLTLYQLVITCGSILVTNAIAGSIK